MIPSRAMIPVKTGCRLKDGWVNLKEITNDLSAHPEKVKKFADNSVKTPWEQYLTSAAEACYWRKLIKGSGSVSFELQFHMTMEPGDVCLSSR